MADQTQIQSPPDGAIRNVSQLIGAIEDGSFNADLSHRVEDLVRRLNDQMLIGRKAKGAVTIKIGFVADRGAIDVSASYSIKEPEEPRSRTVLYIANGAFLSARDPRQSAMRIHTVDGNRPEIRLAD